MAKAPTSTQTQSSTESLRRELAAVKKEKEHLEVEVAGQLAAVNRSQAVIEFDLDGTIITANENFLKPMGYTLQEVQGRHHSIFVDSEYRNSVEYKEFWERLGRGEFIAGQYKRIGKNGKEIWIQGSYTPILDKDGKPFKVVKFATDVTEQKLRSADHQEQIAAIHKSLAVIEFEMDGTIITANDVFLSAMGYSLDEVKGRHHRMFVDPEEREGQEYRDFWARLNRGEFMQAEYRRIGKDGKEVWIQGSYNPIVDLNGRPCKVVKYAIDVTDRARLEQTAARQREKTAELIHEVIESAHQFAEGARVIAESLGGGNECIGQRNDQRDSSHLGQCKRIEGTGHEDGRVGQ